MPKVNKVSVSELEEWIELNQCKGERAVFKILCIEEKEDLGGFYTKRVEGVRYKWFGVHRAHDGYRVTHLRSGGQCGDVFSSENGARRLAFCLGGLADWKTVEWSDSSPHLSPTLLRACEQAYDYCGGIEGSYDTLLSVVLPLLPENEDDIVVEVEIVDFGSDEAPRIKPSSKKVVAASSSEKDGWGEVVT